MSESSVPEKVSDPGVTSRELIGRSIIVPTNEFDGRQTLTRVS